MIKLKTIGKILNGIYLGWYILVEPAYGGYTVFISTSKINLGNVGRIDNLEDGEGYDIWIQDQRSLEYTFERYEWNIDWDVV